MRAVKPLASHTNEAYGGARTNPSYTYTHTRLLGIPICSVANNPYGFTCPRGIVLVVASSLCYTIMVPDALLKWVIKNNNFTYLQ